LLLLSWVVTVPVVSMRQRTCCKYSCDESDCPSWCNSQHDCVLRNSSGIIEERIEGCRVNFDSKKEKTEDSIVNCLQKSYDGSQKRLGSQESSLPFFVTVYPFKGINQFDSHFSGIDIRYKIGEINRLSFRIKNTNGKVCPSTSLPEERLEMPEMLLKKHNSPCHPRCVDIDLTGLERSPGLWTETYLSYDCEAGFYILLGNWVSSSHHDYRLSICADRSCGEFLFQLPEFGSVSEEKLVLVDEAEYEEKDLVVMWIPVEAGTEQYHIKLVRQVDNTTNIEVVHTVNVTLEPDLTMQKVQLNYVLSSGSYQVLLYPIVNSQVQERVLRTVFFTRPSYSQHTLSVITAILVTILLSGLILSIYRQWQTVAENGAVEPRDLVEAGRMEEARVLVITSLDNPDHVEIVKMLCTYLKDWCGVGTTYFAFDEATGIGIEQNDPWKWCQETGDKVMASGSVLYIPGPDPSLSNDKSIFPNLEQNQAFVTTRHLAAMGSEGRVMLVKFPYSSIKTVPKEVPDHVKSASFSLPKQMNEFLIQLLQVKKKALCSLLPCNLVKPEIRPASLARAGGPQIMQKIRELSAKDAKHRQAMQAGSATAAAAQPPPIIREDREDPAETAALLRKEIQNFNCQNSKETLKIELEPGLPSIRQMEDRQKFEIE